jgi:hypothetical protein
MRARCCLLTIKYRIVLYTTYTHVHILPWSRFQDATPSPLFKTVYGYKLQSTEMGTSTHQYIRIWVLEPGILGAVPETRSSGVPDPVGTGISGPAEPRVNRSPCNVKLYYR